MKKTVSKKTIYLSLGSNMGDRMEALSQAEKKIVKSPHMSIVDRSQIYETEPWPQHEISGEHPHVEKGQNWFLNQVMKIETMLTPQAILKACQEIEKEIGRVNKGHWGPRTIDIDILLYEDEIIDLPELQIPHRHMHDRQFVLIPLLEIEPKLKDPITGKLYRDIFKEIRDNHKVISYF